MIKLKKLLNESNLPNVLFHSVRNETAKDYVLKHGIKSDEDSMVYLSKKPIRDTSFSFVFKVKIPDMNKLWNWDDIWDEGSDKENDPKNPYYIYEGDIPKQYITLVKL